MNNTSMSINNLMPILIDYLYCGLKSIDLIVLRYYTLLYLLKRNAEEREKRYNNDDDNNNSDDKIDGNIHLRSSSSSCCSNQKRCYDDYNNDNKDNEDDYNDIGDDDIVHGRSKSIKEFDFILNRRDVDDIHNIQLSLSMVINILSPYLDTLLCADIRQCYRDWRNEHNHGGGDNRNGSSSSGVVDIETKILLKICVDDHCWKQSWELSTALSQCMIDLSNLSIQLLLHDLSNKMITIIEQNICIQNVLIVYRYSIFIHHYQLQNSCLIFISNHYQNIQYYHHQHQQQNDSTMYSLINNHDMINKLNNLIIKHSVEIVSKKIFFERLNKIQESINLNDKNNDVVVDDDDNDDEDEDYHDARNGNDHIDENVVVVDNDDDGDNDDDWNTVISIPVPLVDPIPITTSTTTTTTTTNKRSINRTITTNRDIIITNRSVTDHTWHYDEAPTLEGRDDIPNSICLPKYLGKLQYLCITSIVRSISPISSSSRYHIIECTYSDLHSYELLY